MEGVRSTTRNLRGKSGPGEANTTESAETMLLVPYCFLSNAQIFSLLAECATCNVATGTATDLQKNFNKTCRKSFLVDPARRLRFRFDVPPLVPLGKKPDLTRFLVKEVVVWHPLHAFSPLLQLKCCTTELEADLEAEEKAECNGKLVFQRWSAARCVLQIHSVC